MSKANPVLFEPIMKVEVTMPEDYMGDVIGDINSRRGRIEGMDDHRRRQAGKSICTACLKCSVIPQTCAPRLRDVATIPCSSRNMSRYRRTYRKKCLLQRQNKVVNFFLCKSA